MSSSNNLISSRPPSISHHSIKRKETAGVLVGGGRGSRVCWLRTNSPFCNHSFPEVALPFRPAQTDNHRAPVALVVANPPHPPLPHPWPGGQSPTTPTMASPRIERAKLLVSQVPPPKKQGMRTQGSSAPAPPNNRERPQSVSILPELFSTPPLSRSALHRLPHGFPF